MTAKYSATVATIMLACAFTMLGGKFSAWSDMEFKAQMYVIGVLSYLIVLVTAGWFYVCRHSLAFGIIHLLLMLGIACLGIAFGVVTYSNRVHIAGGSGPDANPVAPVMFLTALMAIIVGLIAATCVIGVARDLKKWKVR